MPKEAFSDQHCHPVIYGSWNRIIVIDWKHCRWSRETGRFGLPEDAEHDRPSAGPARIPPPRPHAASAALAGRSQGAEAVQASASPPSGKKLECFCKHAIINGSPMQFERRLGGGKLRHPGLGGGKISIGGNKIPPAKTPIQQARELLGKVNAFVALARQVTYVFYLVSFILITGLSTPIS